MLILHAPRDAIVGIDNAAAIFTAAKHPKSFLSLDQADHLLSKTEDSQFAADMILAWARRCLGEPAKLERYDLGVKVIIFLLVFLWAARALKKEYWKDVH